MTFAAQNIVRDRFAGVMGFTDATEEDRFYEMGCRRKQSAMISDGGTAGTAVTESKIASAGSVCGALVKKVTVAFPVAVTANNTDYITVTVSKRAGATGASSATVAQVTSQTTDAVLGSNAVAFVEYSMTLTAANLVLAAGDILTVAVAKTGAGKAIAAATSYVQVTATLEETST